MNVYKVEATKYFESQGVKSVADKKVLLMTAMHNSKELVSV